MFVERAYRLPKQVEQLELFGVRTRATTKRINLDKMDCNSLKAACPLETRECGHTRMWPSAQETRETEAKEQNKEREKERETTRTFGRKAARIRSPAHMNILPTCNYIGLRVEFPMRSVSGFVEVWPTQIRTWSCNTGAHIAGFTGRLSNRSLGVSLIPWPPNRSLLLFLSAAVITFVRPVWLRVELRVLWFYANSSCGFLGI